MAQAKATVWQYQALTAESPAALAGAMNRAATEGWELVQFFAPEGAGGKWTAFVRQERVMDVPMATPPQASRPSVEKPASKPVATSDTGRLKAAPPEKKAPATGSSANTGDDTFELQL